MRPAMRIALLYVVLGVGWIVGSDYVSIISDETASPEEILRVQLTKGVCFVLVTGTVLYALVRRLLVRERKQALERERSDARFRRIADSELLAVFFWKKDGRITCANDRLLQMINYSREELAQGAVRWDHLTPAEFAHLDRAALKDIGSKGSCTPYETVYLDKDGNRVPILLGSAAVDERGDEGVSFVLDLRRQKEVEQRLREKEQELRDALNSLPHVFIIYDADRRIRFANSRLFAKLGMAPDEVLGRRDEDLLPPEELSVYQPTLARTFETAQVQELIINVETVEDTKVSQMTFAPVLGPSGEVLQVMAIEQDITQNTAARHALEESQRELRQIIDLVPHFIFAKDLDGRFVLANRAVAEAYGTTADELLGRTDAEVNGSDAEVEHFRHDDMQVIHRGEAKHIPREVMTDATGSERVLETIKIPFKRSGDKLPAVLGVSTDITDRTRAEEALRRSEKRFRTLVENAVDAFFLHDRTGRIVDVNNRACESLGYTRDELLQLTMVNIEANYHAGDLGGVWQRMRLGHPATFDGVHLRKDGSTFPVEVLINLVEAANGTLLLAVARDVTERYRSELEVSALSQLGLSLSSAETFDQIATAFFDVADLLCNWDAGFFSIKRSGEARYRQILAYDTLNGKRERFPRREYDVPQDSALGAVHRGEPCLIHRTDKNEDNGLPAFGDTERRSESLLFVPLRLGQEPVGLISLQSYTPGVFNQADVELFTRTAALIAPALERARAEERGAAYIAMGEELSGVTTPEEVARIILELADRLIGWDSASVSLYTPEDDTVYSVLEMDILNGERREVEPVRHRKPPGGNMRRTLQEGPLLILRTPADTPEGVETFGDRVRRSRSILWTPIRSGAKVSGLLSIQSYSYDAYNSRDLEVLQGLANHCGAALERTRAQNALRESEERYRRAIQGAGAVPYQLEDATRSYSFVGEDIERITGYTPAEFTGDLMRAITLETVMLDTAQNEVDPRKAKPRLWKEWRADVRLRAKSGEERWISNYAVQINNDMGNPKGSLGILVDITDRKRAEQALRRSEELYRRAITQADAVPYQLEYATNSFTFIGEGIERISGYNAEGFTTDDWLQMVQEVIMRGEAAGMTAAEAAKAARSGGIQQWQADLRIRTRSGEMRWLADSAIQVRDENGQALASLGILHDVTDRKRTEEALRESEERYALAAQGANDGLWDWDLRSNKIFYSARWKEMLGYGTGELDDSPDQWFGRIHPEDEERVRHEIDAHTAGASDHLESEHRMLHREGPWLWMLCRGVVVRDAQDVATRIAGSLTDITETREAQERLLHDALHDALTGLPNRSLLLDRLGRSLERSRRKAEYQFAVLFLDLDRFKNINDSLGHLMGDEVLTTISARLVTCLRPGDTVARFAGDEFAMLLDDVSDIKAVRAVTERVLVEIRKPMLLGGHEIVVSSSIGVAVGNPNYISADELLRDADTALYRAKARGKDRYQVFDPEMHQHVVEALSLENDFRRALERQDLSIYYQPIIDLTTGRISGLEALLRWQKNGSFVPPDRFIPLAEETGLIVGLGNWVLQEVAKQIAAWTEFPDLYVTINISPRQFVEPDLDSRIEAIFSQAGVESSRIGLEITETALMASPDDAARVLQRLHLAGFRLYLDDFGTGYSSLSYLHRFPIDVVKIDKSFVMRMKDTGREREIVQSIMMLASGLKLSVTAEGVETPEQLEIIRALGCHAAQGYRFSPALPPDEVLALMRSAPSW